MGEKSREHAEPHRGQWTFSAFEIIIIIIIKTHQKKKTQPGNPPKQLVCFIGVLGKGRKTILKAPSVSRLCTLSLRERFLQLPLGCSHLRVWLPK